jgi:hypothetical protein
MAVAQEESGVARARFARAVYALAVGTESLQERVGAAWLELMGLQQGDLPAHLHAAFAVVEAELLAAPEDPATLAEAEAVAAAERILRLAIALWGS